jgi:hypothetical protein
MTRTPTPPRGGIAGLLFVFCIAACAVGLGFDFGLEARSEFWIGARPGAAAALGVGGAVLAVLGGRAAQALLGRVRREGGD